MGLSDAIIRVGQLNCQDVNVTIPYDSEVEYLESTGTQWIDTGVPCSTSIGFFIDGIILTSSTDDTYPGLIGLQEDFDEHMGVYEDHQLVYSGNSYNEIVSDINKRMIVQENWMQSGQIVVTIESNVESVQYSPMPEFNFNIYLFALGCSSGVSCISKQARIYGAKISDGHQLVRDFQPVRFTNELGNPEGAMYDKVSGRLFKNQGTGYFAYGNDK